MRQSNQRRSARDLAGFTLVELMVALMAGAIAITSIYAISSVSARHFHEQQRIARLQTSVRNAMSQLTRDIARAGYLGTPNSRRERRCGAAPPQEVQALEYLFNEDTDSLPNAGENKVRADVIRMTGNYLTDDRYIVRLDSSGGNLILQPEWQAFRRSFGVPGDGFSAEAFQEVFAAGRVMHVISPYGAHFFPTIQSSSGTNRTVRVNPPIPYSAACAGGGTSGEWSAAPLMRIQYSVADISTSANYGRNIRPPGARYPTSVASDFTGQFQSSLVRQEVQWGPPMAASVSSFVGTVAGRAGRVERVVMEYLAAVEYEVVWDRQRTSGSAPTMWRPPATALQQSEDQARSRPEQARSVLISLSGRIAEQDDRFRWVNRPLGAPLTRYRVNPRLPGAARVRTASTEVFLSNLAARNLR
jgi:prepilin-type N-terminal cleavage/methylation domain-containing protein